MEKAKIFWSGRSQAVRLPKAYRFDTDEVRISRRGNAVILEPLTKDWEWLKKMPGRVDEDFEAAVNEKLPMPPDNPEIDEYFK